VLGFPPPGAAADTAAHRAAAPCAEGQRAALVIVGASFTAGIGSGPGRSWGVLLARHLRWHAVVSGVPGAGYVRAGASGGAERQLGHQVERGRALGPGQRRLARSPGPSGRPPRAATARGTR